MAAVLKGLISICVVVIILVSSWLIAVLINYYGGQGKELKFRQTTDSDSFPDDKYENIFWFMQVSVWGVFNCWLFKLEVTALSIE